MNKTLKLGAALGVALGLAAVSTSISAHDGATGVVKERMGSMANLGSAMKGIKANLQASTKEQNEGLLLAATMIMEHSGGNLNKLFPKGSTDAPSRALPSIWENKAQFDAISNRLNDASLALALNASKALGKDASGLREGLIGERGEIISSLSDQAVPVIFKTIAGTCGACHQTYRAPK